MISIKPIRATQLAMTSTLFGIAAGAAELVVGTASWIGNKNDPTTLGWVTIGIALVVTLAALVAERLPTPGARFAAGIVILIAAAVGLTTAGLAWIPAAIAAATCGALDLLAAHRQRPIHSLIVELWPAGLLVVLACIYLAFGIVAGGGNGVLGIAGAAAVCVALVLRRHSRLGAAILLIGGTLPFAVVAAWTVVVPVTAALILAIGLPLVHASHPPNRIGLFAVGDSGFASL